MLYLFIYLFISIFSSSKEFEDNFFTIYAKDMIKNIINNTYNESNICEKDIHSSFQEETSLNYLINSSSLENNDITSYFSCNEEENNNFYIITFKPVNATEERIRGTYDINYSLYGICIYNNSLNCTNYDIIKYLRKIANQTELLNGKNMRVTNINKVSKMKIETIHYFMLIIFGMLTICIIIFSILPIVPQYLFKCFFLRKKIIKSVDNEDIMIKNVDKLSLYNFCKCFSLEENSDYLICSHTHNKSYGSYGITNDEGLGYIKGIFGIFIVMTLFGLFFIQLLSEPYKNYDKQTFENMFYNPLKGFINLSARYGPRVLFSCSGYIFIFKLCCFFEEQITEKVIDNNSSSYSGNRSTFNNKRNKSNSTEEDESCISSSNEIKKNVKTSNNLFDIEEEGSNLDSSEEKYGKENRKKRGSTINNIDRLMTANFNQIFKPKKKDPDSISLYCLYFFYRAQLYKIILVILSIFFIKYVLFVIFDFFEIPGPALISFRNNLIDGISYSEIFGRIFQYLNFKVLISKEETTNYSGQNGKNMCVVFLFWPIINELFFFIFTVPIVFVTYKLKKNLLYILSILAAFIIILRIILFSVSTGEEKMYSTLFYYVGDYYGLFACNPIINYSSFLIGCIFGYFYYLSQRIQDDKEYLGRSNNIIYFFRYQNKNLYYIINSILTFVLFILIFFEQIFFNVSLFTRGDEFSLYSYLSNFFINYFYLIDNDLFLCIFHYLMFSLFCKNENFLMKYLSKDMWEISLKIYLSFSLFVNFLIIFIMEKTQTKINIQLFSILYYGVLSWCILFIVTYIFSILFEIPFKRMSHYIFKIDEKTVNERKEKNK